jgi:hypothetical protein
MASDTVGASPELTPSRAWLLRVPAVLLSPRSVFVPLREEDDDDVAARSEPLPLSTVLRGTPQGRTGSDFEGAANRM